MDVNDLRTIITSLSFFVFIGIVTWAYSGRQKKHFEEAANLPFADAELPGELSGQAGHTTNSKENSTGVRS
jgi:cytochrome c oxidase cbb3-type subunit 4